MERRLAAIVAADVVGYSRLMAADEKGTHARLKTLRKDFIEPKIAEHHGRIVKLMGDGPGQGDRGFAAARRAEDREQADRDLAVRRAPVQGDERLPELLDQRLAPEEAVGTPSGTPPTRDRGSG